MTEQREQLIAQLAADLAPLRAPGRTSLLTGAWMLAAIVFSFAGLIATGSFRPGGVDQLVDTPQFLVESLVGVFAIVALAASGFRLSIPSMRPPLARCWVPLLLLVAWVGFYVYGLFSPALEASMIGKRPDCWYETTLIGIPGLLIGLVAARGLWPLYGGWSGLLLGLAAGAMPALLMQIACIYIPQHILMFHLAPGLLLGPVGAVAGVLWLRPR